MMLIIILFEQYRARTLKTFRTSYIRFQRPKDLNDKLTQSNTLCIVHTCMYVCILYAKAALQPASCLYAETGEHSARALHK